MNIFRRQGGICLKNSLLVGTLCHLANDQFHWNPRAPDDGFSEHDFRVDFDPIVSSHCRSLPTGHGCPTAAKLTSSGIPIPRSIGPLSVRELPSNLPLRAPDFAPNREQARLA